jgi:acylpyruvate hydrolase
VKLATLRTPDGNVAVRVDGDTGVELGVTDVGQLLAMPEWEARVAAADGPRHPLAGADFAPVVPAPGKILCVGLNYAAHIREMGRELPEFPTLFAKFTPALVGAYDDIVLPRVSDKIDWEVELTIVIGRSVRHATSEQAEAAIAGYTVLNDVSVRDYQRRTSQFLQGKTFDRTTPLGPWLVTSDQVPAGGLDVSTVLDGETMQRSNTAELVFSPVDLVVYLSTIMTLNPGDVIATGTPGGVGHARKPPRYLTDGALVVTTVAGVGECRNTCRLEKAQ